MRLIGCLLASLLVCACASQPANAPLSSTVVVSAQEAIDTVAQPATTADVLSDSPTPGPIPTETRAIADSSPAATATQTASPTSRPPDTATPTATPLPTNTATPTKTPVPAPTTPAAPMLTVAGPVANVRGGPGTVYQIVGQVRQGDVFTITGRNDPGSWWQFSFGQGSGWISASLVEVNDSADSVEVAANIPAAPPPTATPVAQPTTPAATASVCPDWYQPPAPGMGVLVVENHHAAAVPAIFEEIGVQGQSSLPQKVNDVPGRLVLQLAPGHHTFKIEFPTCCKVMLDIDIEAGQSYISPIDKPWLAFDLFGSPSYLGTIGVVYPLTPPEGC